MLHARNWERSRLGACGNDDVLCLQNAICNKNLIGSFKCCFAAYDVYAAIRHRPGKRARNMTNHLLFAIDQRGPIEMGVSNTDLMLSGTVNLVDGMTCGHG